MDASSDASVSYSKHFEYFIFRRTFVFLFRFVFSGNFKRRTWNCIVRMLNQCVITHPTPVVQLLPNYSRRRSVPVCTCYLCFHSLRDTLFRKYVYVCAYILFGKFALLLITPPNTFRLPIGSRLAARKLTRVRRANFRMPLQFLNINQASNFNTYSVSR